MHEVASPDFGLLLQTVEPTSRAQQALLAAQEAGRRGDQHAADRHYAAFVEAQTTVLTLTEAFNRTTPTPSPLAPIAQTLVNGLFMWADTLDALGRMEAGEATRQRALDWSRRYLDAGGHAEATRSLAASLIARSRFTEALMALYEARDRHAGLGQPLKAARVSMDLGDIYQWLGDYDRAIEHIDAAAALARDAPLREGLEGLEDFAQKQRIEAEYPFFRGIIARYAGRYEEAEPFLADALRRYQGLGSGFVGVQYQWAALLNKRGRAAEALALLREIEPAMRADELLRPRLPALLRAEAEALLALGRPAEALDLVAQALEAEKLHTDPDLRWSIQWLQAGILGELGRLEEAMAAYEAAAATVASLRRVPLGYQLDNAFLSGRFPLFREAIQLAAGLQRPRAAAALIEQVKARSLSAIMGAPAAAPQRAEPELATEFEAVTSRLDALEYESFSNRAWTPAGEKERGQLLRRRTELLERLRISDPRWRGITELPELDLDDLVDGLRRRNQSALTLFLDRPWLTTVLLSPQGLQVERMELPAAVLGELDAYLDNLTLAQPRARFFDPSAALGLQAEELVPVELLDAALHAASLVVIPHRELHLLPWAALLYRDTRLFERLPVGVLPNLACLARLAYEPSASPAVALVGPPDYTGLPDLQPLYSAAVEIAQLRELYGEARVLHDLRGPAATEAGLKQLLGDAGGDGTILHVCGHASTEPVEPMNTGLLLTGGKLDAAEIARTRVPFDEVVLSACSTGWRPARVSGIDLIADDCLGLPGAFLEAGARSVLVSIPVAHDEAARDFMLRYHRARQAAPPLAAYRAAQLGMLREEQFIPAFWAGITLYGCC